MLIILMLRALSLNKKVFPLTISSTEIVSGKTFLPTILFKLTEEARIELTTLGFGILRSTN